MTSLCSCAQCLVLCAHTGTVGTPIHCRLYTAKLATQQSPMKCSRIAGDDDATETRPLLEDESDSGEFARPSTDTTPAVHSGRRHDDTHSGASLLHTLAALLHGGVDACLSSLGTVFHWIFRVVGRGSKLTAEQKAKIDQVRTLLKDKFEHDNPEHQVRRHFHLPCACRCTSAPLLLSVQAQ